MGVECSAVCVLQYAVKTYASANMYLYSHILLKYPRRLYILLPGCILRKFLWKLVPETSVRSLWRRLYLPYHWELTSCRMCNGAAMALSSEKGLTSWWTGCCYCLVVCCCHNRLKMKGRVDIFLLGNCCSWEKNRHIFSALIFFLLSEMALYLALKGA